MMIGNCIYNEETMIYKYLNLLLQGNLWNVSFITCNPPLLHIHGPMKKKSIRMLVQYFQ